LLSKSFCVLVWVVVLGFCTRIIGIIAAFIVKILLAAFIIAVSASALVASAEVLAERMGIPDVVISSTLVAFGTSVPELSTCIAAARSNHGG